MSGPATARAELLDRARGGERRALAQLISAAERGEALTALLGDRLRMPAHAASPRVFIRSMAARGHRGAAPRW